jgi:hypothetical protein
VIEERKRSQEKQHDAVRKVDLQKMNKSLFLTKRYGRDGEYSKRKNLR